MAKQLTKKQTETLAREIVRQVMKVSNKKISRIYEFKYPNYKEGIKQVIVQLKEKNRL